jgi:5'-3' exonuclease
LVLYAGGYINDGGTLHIGRLEMIFKELTTFEREIFEGEDADTKWFKGKQRKELAKLQERTENAELGTRSTDYVFAKCFTV